MGHTGRPRLRPDLALEEVDGESVVVDPVDGSLHHLNASATLLALRCDGTRSTSRIAEELAAPRAGAGAERSRREVRAFLRSLDERGLLVSDEHRGTTP